MTKTYTKLSDEIYQIDNPITCCQQTTKADLANARALVAANISQLTARLAELDADIAAINAIV